MESAKKPINKALQALFFIFFPVWFCLLIAWMAIIYCFRAVEFAWNISGDMARFWFGNSHTEAME